MTSPGRPRRAARARERLGLSVTVILHQARRERGLTRAELARRAQVSEQTLAKIEQGRSTDPGFTVVAAVAASLGLRLDDLVERARQAATAEDES
ncbi:MAG TPA: helix-turn-helix transcriptional regulator [Streptosporangiaceae bacterium]|nr:helix-turn-helix transcriptional regulator [Streptosporangiaceae bacterium]